MYQIMPPMHLEQDRAPQFGSVRSFGAAPSDRIGLPMDDDDNSHPSASGNCSGRRPSCGSESSERINWSLTYSSDEESQVNQRLHRSYSDPSLEESMLVRDPIRSLMYQEPRRRSRSSCSRDNEDLLIEGGGSRELQIESCSEKDKGKASSTVVYHGLASSIRSALTCSPTRILFVLFVVCSYTTFFLPYPGVRPQVNQMPLIRQEIPGSPLTMHNQSTPLIAKASPGMYQARAAPELELTFRPGLERYYAQEGFSTYAWTKYANIMALGTVAVWAAVELRQRGDVVTAR